MMWKLFSDTTGVLIQGMTGKEGRRMTAWLRQSGVRVCAGVTPGKGGQFVDGCPVFSTVEDAYRAFPEIEVTSVVVPAPRVRAAVEEALNAGIKYIHILTESVPVHDVLALRASAVRQGASILGPSSVGYLQFPRFRIGYIGGEDPFRVIQPGRIALISTSGGMTNELMMAFARKRIGVRMALAIGGDRVPAFSLEEAILFCESCSEIDRIVIFAEPGCPFFTRLLQRSFVPSRPFVVFLAGESLDSLPREKAYGHTGTLLQEGESSVASLRASLLTQGIPCVATTAELVSYVQPYV